MAEVNLEELAKDVAYLKDRLAIQDVVHRFARGHDRFDIDLMTATFHDDGVDDHGTWAINTGPEYGEWANKTHEAGNNMCLHNMTTHTCEIDGDVAHAESYVMGAFLNKDGVTCRLLNGRYVDRLEKRDGTWRIALRRCTIDVALKGDASIMSTEQFKSYGMIKGSRDSGDVSYARPLTLEDPVGRW